LPYLHRRQHFDEENQDMSMRVRVVSVIFAFVVGAAVVRADWTAVASTGTIDEGDLGKIVLNNDGSAAIRSTISSTSAKVRFNVTAVTGIEPPPPGAISGGLVFAMRFRDNGAGARVFATLKRVTLEGFHLSRPQSTDVLGTIDSDLVAQSNGWQTAWSQHANWKVLANGLSFLDDGYVVEVQLIKHDATGDPGIMGVQLFRDET
jgi:hypothetical protein